MARRSYTPRDSKAAHPGSSNIDKPWWKYPQYWAVGIIGTGFLTVPVFIDSKITRVISIQANDISQSAQSLPILQQQNCEARAKQLKSGDKMVDVEFADRPEMIRDTEVNNTLLLLGECKPTKPDPKQPPSGVGKQPGTSPILLLDRVQTVIEEKRAKGLNNPVVVTIALQAAEPGPGQPKLDFNRIQEQVETITADKGVVVILGPNGQLQADLHSKLKGNPNAKVCTFKDIAKCVDWSFERGRQLSGK